MNDTLAMNEMDFECEYVRGTAVQVDDGLSVFDGVVVNVTPRGDIVILDEYGDIMVGAADFVTLQD